MSFLVLFTLKEFLIGGIVLFGLLVVLIASFDVGRINGIAAAWVTAAWATLVLTGLYVVSGLIGRIVVRVLIR